MRRVDASGTRFKLRDRCPHDDDEGKENLNHLPYTRIRSPMHSGQPPAHFRSLGNILGFCRRWPINGGAAVTWGELNDDRGGDQLCPLCCVPPSSHKNLRPQKCIVPSVHLILSRNVGPRCTRSYMYSHHCVQTQRISPQFLKWLLLVQN